MKVIKNIIQLLIILMLVSYIIYEKAYQEEAVAYQEERKSEYRVHTFDIPDKLDFAGEKVPLDDIEVRERLDREMHVNTYWHSSTILTLKIGEPLCIEKRQAGL